MLRAIDRTTQVELSYFLSKRAHFPSLGCQIKANLDLDKERDFIQKEILLKNVLQ